MNDIRFSINADNALPHAVLWQTYSVEDVARIAATCAGASHHERVIEALKLIKAVEDIANPYAPWMNQDSRRKEGDGLGVIPDVEKENALYDLQEQADELIRLATDADGRINRVNLCRIACDVAGRKSPKGDPLSSDRVETLFRKGWLPQAAEEHARWELFRKMHNDALRERDELQSALELGLSKRIIGELRKKVAATEKLSFKSGGQCYPAAEEIGRRREAVSEQEKKAEREAFRLSMETGTHNQPRILRTEDHARTVLLGTGDFAGFLAFLLCPDDKPKYIPSLPQTRDGGGAFVKREKDEEGKVKPVRKASQVDEFDSPSAQFNEAEGTEKRVWKKR